MLGNKTGEERVVARATIRFESFKDLLAARRQGQLVVSHALILLRVLNVARTLD